MYHSSGFKIRKGEHKSYSSINVPSNSQELLEFYVIDRRETEEKEKEGCTELYINMQLVSL